MSKLKAKRQQTLEIDKILRLVDEGLEEFSQIWGDGDFQVNSKQEQQLRAQLQKLQKYRTQVRGWLDDASIPEYHVRLQNARVLIEAEMRRFKVSEKSARAKNNEEDFQTGPRAAAIAWADHCGTKLQVEIARLEEETSKKQKRQREEQIGVYRRHLDIIQRIQQALEDEIITTDDITDFQDIVSDYVEDISKSYTELGFDVYDDILELIEQGGHEEEEEEHEPNPSAGTDAAKAHAELSMKLLADSQDELGQSVQNAGQAVAQLQLQIEAPDAFSASAGLQADNQANQGQQQGGSNAQNAQSAQRTQNTEQMPPGNSQADRMSRLSGPSQADGSDAMEAASDVETARQRSGRSFSAAQPSSGISAVDQDIDDEGAQTGQAKEQRPVQGLGQRLAQGLAQSLAQSSAQQSRQPLRVVQQQILQVKQPRASFLETKATIPLISRGGTAIASDNSQPSHSAQFQPISEHPTARSAQLSQNQPFAGVRGAQSQGDSQQLQQLQQLQQANSQAQQAQQAQQTQQGTPAQITTKIYKVLSTASGRGKLTLNLNAQPSNFAQQQHQQMFETIQPQIQSFSAILDAFSELRSPGLLSFKCEEEAQLIRENALFVAQTRSPYQYYHQQCVTASLRQVPLMQRFDNYPIQRQQSNIQIQLSSPALQKRLEAAKSVLKADPTGFLAVCPQRFQALQAAPAAFCCGVPGFPASYTQGLLQMQAQNQSQNSCQQLGQAAATSAQNAAAANAAATPPSGNASAATTNPQVSASAATAATASTASQNSAGQSPSQQQAFALPALPATAILTQMSSPQPCALSSAAVSLFHCQQAEIQVFDENIAEMAFYAASFHEGHRDAALAAQSLRNRGWRWSPRVGKWVLARDGRVYFYDCDMTVREADAADQAVFCQSMDVF